MQEAVVQFTEGSLAGKPATVTDPARPEWLPENFKTVEDYATSYKELQAELTRLKQANGEEAGTTEEEEQKAPPSSEEIDEQAKAAGVDMEALQAEFDADGKLSDASYENLSKMGFDKTFVDEIIELRAGQAEKMRSELLATVGGEAGLNEMITWAVKGYSPEQIEAYNEAVNSGSRVKAELALKALKADFTAANPKRPKLLNGTTDAPAGEATGAYKSTAELARDQKDPRYKSDPAFREMVKNRLRLSQAR